MTEKAYHLGLLTKHCQPYGYHWPHKADTLVMQAARSIDNLSPDLWVYYGERVITKAQLRQNATIVLEYINRIHNTAYTKLIIK